MTLAQPALVALMGLVFATPVHAAGATISFFGGMNVANVSGKSSTFEPQSKLGAVGGAAFGIPVGQHWVVAPEIGYAVRGFSWGESEHTDFTGQSLGTFETFTVTSVLTVSCSVRRNFHLGGPFDANVSLGPTLGIESGEKFANSLGGSFDNDFLRDGDFGLLAGAGVEVPAGPGHAGLTARWVQGFSDLSRDPLVAHRTRDFELVASYTGLLGR